MTQSAPAQSCTSSLLALDPLGRACNFDLFRRCSSTKLVADGEIGGGEMEKKKKKEKAFSDVGDQETILIRAASAPCGLGRPE